MIGKNGQSLSGLPDNTKDLSHQSPRRRERVWYTHMYPQTHKTEKIMAGNQIFSKMHEILICLAQKPQIK